MTNDNFRTAAEEIFYSMIEPYIVEEKDEKDEEDTPETRLKSDLHQAAAEQRAESRPVKKATKLTAKQKKAMRIRQKEVKHKLRPGTHKRSIQAAAKAWRRRKSPSKAAKVVRVSGKR